MSERDDHLNWPDPTPEMLETPAFEAIWQTIKRWDINVPDAYAGYCGATGNHVRAISDALQPALAAARLEGAKEAREQIVKSLEGMVESRGAIEGEIWIIRSAIDAISRQSKDEA